MTRPPRRASGGGPSPRLGRPRSGLIRPTERSIRKARATLAQAASLAFFGTVSAGLAGTSGDNGSLNLALDDAPVAGVVVRGDVKGCPSYAQVRQPSMDGFDVTKYTGRWYEHAHPAAWIWILDARGTTSTKVPRLDAVRRGVRHDAGH